MYEEEKPEEAATGYGNDQILRALVIQGDIGVQTIFEKAHFCTQLIGDGVFRTQVRIAQYIALSETSLSLGRGNQHR
jgi:hypothetical protein